MVGVVRAARARGTVGGEYKYSYLSKRYKKGGLLMRKKEGWYCGR